MQQTARSTHRSPGLLVGALACTAMMAVMMRGMSGSDSSVRDG